MCLKEQLHYASVTVTTHKSWWSSTFIPMHKSTDTHHRHCTTSVVTGESFASKAGLALIEMGGKKIPGSALHVFRDNQESKKADCCRQFDHPLLGMGSPLPDWNRPLPRGLRPHWTGEVGTVIISWAYPKSLPISLFPTCTRSILDMSLAAPTPGHVDMLLPLTVS